MNLRPYQQDIVNEVEFRLDCHYRAPMVVLPTGGGKTVVFSQITRNATDNGQRVWIVAHRQELLSQASRALGNFGIENGIVRAGVKTDLRQQVLVASAQTLVRRLGDIPRPDLIILDECHHGTTPTMGKIFSHFPGCDRLGVTATPCRLNGAGLGAIFDNMILGPTNAFLTENGYLSPAKYYAPPVKADLSKLRMQAGDFAIKQSQEAMDEPTITGDAISHYKAICDGAPMLVFCTSVSHAHHVAEQYVAAGYRAAAVDGNLSDDDRDDRITGLGTGKYQVITSCDLIGEGLDVPSVTAVQLLRPTASLALHLQQIGRGLRMSEGKDCLASGTKILTQRGLVEIEKVLLTDKLWDGNSWVNHEGVISKGKKPVITYQGLTATEDHQVWTEEGWRSFGECAREQITIVQTGVGGSAIRVGRDRLPGYETHSEQEVAKQGSRLCKMRYLPLREMDFVVQLERREDGGVPEVQSAGSFPKMAFRPHHRNEDAVREPEKPGVQRLWGTRYPVQLRDCVCGGTVGPRESGDSRGPEAPVGPYRQRWSLRSGEPPLVNPAGESVPHPEEAHPSDGTRIPGETPGDSLLRCDLEKSDRDGPNGRTDRGEVPQAFLQTEREVWDILNAGPRNCFTAEGLLVHNCLHVLDHVGNVGRVINGRWTVKHGFASTEHQWTLEPGKKVMQGKAAPTRTCESCFSVHIARKTCPYCGYEYPVREKTFKAMKMVEGKLVEVEQTAEQQRLEVKNAHTFQELLAIARARKYKKPYYWAVQVFRGRPIDISDLPDD